MGLFSKLEAAGSIDVIENAAPITQNTIKTNSVGLLKKSMLLNKGSLDFFDFVRKYKISHIAIFEFTNDNFHISKSFGFNLNSIIKSISTKTFWNGTIVEKDKWYFFQNLGLAPFYQFFDGNLKSIINSVYIYYTTDNKIILIGSPDKTYKEPDSNLISDFYNISNKNLLKKEKILEKEGTYNKVTFSFEDLDFCNNELFFYPIFEEILNIFRLNLNTNFINNIENKNIIIAFENNENFNIKLLYTHISSLIKAYCNNKIKVSFIDDGITSNLEEIITYLRIE